MFPLLIPLLGSLLDKILPDPAAAAQAKLALMNMVQTGELAKLTASADVIKAEATSGNRLASSWRPITMLVFVSIVANNYILAPYLQALFGWHVTLDMPPQLWDLLKIGLGGYVVGRSAEKMMTTYAASKGNTPAANSTNLISNGG